MNLTDKDCMRREGGTCQGLVVDEEEGNDIEVEVAENWVNRVEIID